MLWRAVRWWARRGLPATAGRVATVVAVGRLAGRFVRSTPETIHRSTLKPGEGIEIRTRTPDRKDPRR
jgi:hypothetical protein